jgi:phosphoglycerol transferase MdoB-like AlkP superfamily enzyme
MQTTLPPLVTVPDSLLLVGLLLLAVGYVLAALLVTRWLYRDATRRGRPHADRWTAAVGVSLLSGGPLGVVLLAVYLHRREPTPTVAGES